MKEVENIIYKGYELKLFIKPETYLFQAFAVGLDFQSSLHTRPSTAYDEAKAFADGAPKASEQNPLPPYKDGDQIVYAVFNKAKHKWSAFKVEKRGGSFVNVFSSEADCDTEGQAKATARSASAK
jgi:hypothetical protein